MAVERNEAGLGVAAGEICFWSAPFGLALLEAVRLRPGQRFLDLGCGSGFPALELACRLGSKGRGWGLDPDADALALARARMEARRIPNLELMQGVAEALPFGDGSLDLVVSNNGLNNVADPVQAFAEIARVMEPGGQLVFTANLPGSFGRFYRTLESLLAASHLEERIPAVRAHIAAKRPQMEDWTARVSAAGLKLQRVQELSFGWTFLDGEALFSHPAIRDWFLPVWEALMPEGFMPALQARLDELAAVEGGLRMEIPFVCVEASK